MKSRPKMHYGKSMKEFDQPMLVETLWLGKYKGSVTSR
jgi:hypothetical protein